MNKKIILIFITLLMLTGCSTEEIDEIPEDRTPEENIEHQIDNKHVTFRTINVKDIEGQEITADIFADKLTLVNVWGTFCPPCISEMPELQRIHDEFSSHDVQVLGIITDTFEGQDTNIDTALELIDQTGVQYQNIIPNEDLINNYLGGITSIPVSFLVDENGDMIGEEIIGAKDYEFFKTLIESYL